MDGLLPSLRTRMETRPLDAVGVDTVGEGLALDHLGLGRESSLGPRPSQSRMRGSTVDTRPYSFIRAASFPRRVARARVEREEEPLGEGGGSSSPPASGRPSGVGSMPPSSWRGERCPGSPFLPTLASLTSMVRCPSCSWTADGLR